MNKVVVALGMIIVFISIFSALSILGTMMSKFNECKTSIFSSDEKCDLVAMGKSLMSGVWIISLLSLVSTFSVYVLAKVSSSGKKKEYYSSTWGP
jgi:hypothetical protein